MGQLRGGPSSFNNFGHSEISQWAMGVTDRREMAADQGEDETPGNFCATTGDVVGRTLGKEDVPLPGGGLMSLLSRILWINTMNITMITAHYCSLTPYQPDPDVDGVGGPPHGGQSAVRSPRQRLSGGIETQLMT